MSEDLDTRIGIEKVDLEWFRTISLEGIYVEDLRRDTLLYARSIKGRVDVADLFEKKFQLSQLQLEHPHVELKRYASDSALNHAFLIEHFASEDSSGSEGWEIGTDAIGVDGGTFHFQGEPDAEKERGRVNFRNLRAERIEFEASGIHLGSDSISAFIKDLALHEKHSGFRTDSLATKGSFSSSGIRLKDLFLRTPRTGLTGNLEFLYDDPSEMSDWVRKVHMNVNFERSELGAKDIAYFVDPLKGMELDATLEGRIEGRVADLRAEDFMIGLTPNSYFKGDFDLNGLPNIRSTFITVDAKEMQARKEDLEKIPLPPFEEGNTLSLPPQLNRLGDIAFRGRFTGFVNDFVANGTLNSDPGQLEADISFSRDTSNGHLRYDGTFRATNFDVGDYYRIPDMGRIDARMRVNGSGFGVERVDTRLDGTISRFEYADYSYRDLSLKGELANGHFKGHAGGEDPNFDFDFNGVIDLREEMPSYSFTMDIERMRPGVLNLIEKDSSVFLRTELSFDGEGASLKTLKGELGAYGTLYRENDKTYELGDIELLAEKTEAERTLRLTSSPLLATVKGDFLLSELPQEMTGQLQKVLPSLFGEMDVGRSSSTQDLEFNVKLMEHEKIGEILFPEWDVASNCVVDGSLDAANESFEMEAFIPHIAYRGRQLKGLKMSADRKGDIMEFETITDTLRWSDSLRIEHFHLLGKALDDNLQLQTEWKGGLPKTQGSLESVFTFHAPEQFNWEVLSSEFVIRNEKWEFAPEGKLVVNDGEIRFDGISFQDSTRSFGIEGAISKDPEKELKVSFDDFDLGILAPFVPERLEPRGTINGTALASNLYGVPFFTSDIDVTNTRLAGHLLGELSLSSDWQADKDRLNIDGSLQKEGRETLKLEGAYFPERSEELALDLETRELGLEILNSFIEGGISDIHGNITGALRLGGSLKEPLLTGKVQARDVQVTVSELNVTYGFHDRTITFYEEMIGFDHVPIHYIDPKNGEKVRERGYATGTLLHEHFQKWNLNIFLQMERLLAMDLKRGMNDLYYGTAYASGTLEISGDPETLNIDVAARTEKETDIKLPLGGDEEVRMESFVSFVDKDKEVEKDPGRDLEGIEMDFDMEVTPDAQVSIIFDEKIGDVMRGRGTGNIKMEVSTNGKFKMFGKYEVHQGDYLFTMQNVINKHFSIERGGTIEWFGDPYEANLDLQAIYALRTSLFPLMQGLDEDEAYKRRIPVDLVMNLSRSLLNPELSFDIRFPSLEEQLKTEAMSRIESMNKQAFSLLVLNRFINEQGQGMGSTPEGPGVGTSTSSELLSNQLSNWLSSISKEFDLGVNYRPGDEVTDEELAVALSTQLFNERVSLSGNFGVSSASEYSQQQGRSENNLVGDFTIQYDITENGKFQLKVFNESNKHRIAQIQGADYTQGVGLYYQEEFDSARELLKGLRRLFERDEKEESSSEDPEEGD